jgi:hypothetical protein
MKESIVLGAWEVITRYHSLKKLNFFPSFVGMLWLFCILIYQITYTYVIVFQKKDEFFWTLSDFVHGEYFLEGIIMLVSIFLLYTLLEPIANGGIIQMIDSYKKSKWDAPHRAVQGFFDGLRHFLPIFEVHNITGIFKPLSIITFYILLLRLFGVWYVTSISIIMWVYLVFAFFLNMCFAYSKFFIIFEQKSAINSLGLSTGMALRHINITGRLYFTMILLYLRTILVAVIFLGIPFIVSSILALFTPFPVIQTIFLVIFSVVSLVLFIFIVHLNSTLEIFVEATWYEAYMLCKTEDNAYDWHDEHEQDNHGHETHTDTHHDDHGHH